MPHREPLMNSAPGKELIPELVKAPTQHLLSTFYRMRVLWKCYPILHERMMSSGIFDDFQVELRKQPQEFSKVLDFTLTILQEEDEKYVLCAVCLLSNVCNCAPKDFAPSAVQLQRIEQMRVKVMRFAFIINLASFWEGIVLFAGKHNAPMKQKLSFNATSSPEMEELRLRKNDNALPCPVSIEILKEWLVTIVDDVQIVFRGAMEIGDDRYWLYEYHKAPNNLNKEDATDFLWIHRATDSTHQVFLRKIAAMGDEALRKEIIRYHFSPWEHTAY